MSSLGDYIPKWSCDFENGLCHWLQAIDDEKDFSYIVGGVSGWGDHTTKSPAGIVAFFICLFHYSTMFYNLRLT